VAQLENEQKARLADFAIWVSQGTFAADADAHIVETDGSGIAALRGLQAGSPVFFEVSSAIGTVELKNGATVDFGASLAAVDFGLAPTFNQGATFNGAAVDLNEGALLADGKSIQGGANTAMVAELLVAIDRLQLGSSGSSTLPGQLTVDGGGKLKFREAALDDFVDYSAKGRDKSTGVQEGSSGLAATVLVTTAGTVAPEAAATVAITATFQAQRSGAAGTIATQLQQDQGTGTWIDVGANQQDTIVGNGDPNDWTTITMARDFAAPDTTARAYRIRVTGGATNQLRSARIIAEVTED
jgi:hypothetical protein